MTRHRAPGRVWRWTVVALAVAALAGCGDSEADQRKAFIAFLKERIVDKPGIHIARPTADQEKSWGDYAKHYAIILTFSDQLDQHVSQPMSAAVQRGAFRSIQQLVERRSDLLDVRRGMTEIGTALDVQLAAANQAKAALKQPADLKAVYDAAYDRDVAAPAQAIKDVLPTVDKALAVDIDFADYLTAHAKSVKIDGGMIQTSDPKLQAELAGKISAVSAAAQDVQAKQQKLNAQIKGQ